MDTQTQQQQHAHTSMVHERKTCPCPSFLLRWFVCKIGCRQAGRKKETRERTLHGSTNRQTHQNESSWSSQSFFLLLVRPWICSRLLLVRHECRPSQSKKGKDESTTAFGQSTPYDRLDILFRVAAAAPAKSHCRGYPTATTFRVMAAFNVFPTVP